jgi:hypothetical protein
VTYEGGYKLGDYKIIIILDIYKKGYLIYRIWDFGFFFFYLGGFFFGGFFFFWFVCFVWVLGVGVGMRDSKREMLRKDLGGDGLLM